MGFRYRKSIKLMPGVRMTVSKSGVSYSAGGHGMRVTKTASGRVTNTVGIPGTGVTHTSSSSARRRSAPPPPLPKPSKPGMFASKGEKALYRAVVDNDLRALEAAMQEHKDQALVAATLAALLHVQHGDDARTRQLLAWVLSTNREPTEDELYRKYVSASFTLQIAPGITVELAPTRDALGLLLAELHQDAGDVPAAIAVVEALEPTTVTAVSLADLYDAAGRYDDVVDLTNGVSNEDDATALLGVYRARAFRHLGHHEAARESLKEAMKSRKRDATIMQQALIERALVNLADGKKAQARKDVERVMADDRNHPDVAPLLAAIDGVPPPPPPPTA
jgi:tetratricopeptide (TPR) repeat protein